jgi:hypothetical protein
LSPAVRHVGSGVVHVRFVLGLRLRVLLPLEFFLLRTLAPDAFFLSDRLRLVGVLGEEAGATRVRLGFVDGEVGFDFVLEAELPRVGFGGVLLPDAGVGAAEARVELALLFDAVGEVAARKVGPVVVFPAFGEAQLFPPGFWFGPEWFEQGPQGSAVDHDAVVEVHVIRGVRRARGALGVSRGSTTLGAGAEARNRCKVKCRSPPP